jgi:hypothetical protein
MDRETFKFIMTIVGSCVGVTSFFFTMFQYWRKKQDEKFDLFKASIKEWLDKEEIDRRDADQRHDKRLQDLEGMVAERFESRLSKIEGELKWMGSILKSIQDWFNDRAKEA